MVKMTEEVPGDEGPWTQEDHSKVIDKLREHLRLGGMCVAIDDVRALMKAHDALAERAAEAKQCCGGCRWWTVPPRGRTTGDCNAPLPDSVGLMPRKKYYLRMHLSSGTTCPCFERKSASDV